MEHSDRNPLAEAEIEAATVLAEAIGLEIGRSMFVGIPPPYPLSASLEFTGTFPNDTSIMTAHSLYALPIQASVTIVAPKRETAWGLVCGAINGFPKRNVSERIEMMRVNSFTGVTIQEVQFANQSAASFAHTARLTMSIVVLTGGRTEESGANG